MASEIRVNQIQNRSGLTTTTFTDTGVTISGILTVSDDLNVGGVLTYEDVTNIDAVGVLTARAGINLVGNDLNVGSNIKIGNASGIVTATSFSGSGANLTSLPAQATIANNADNRVITGGSGVNLNGEANLLFDGGTLALNGRYQRGSATVQDGDAIAGGININGLDMDASVIMSVFGNDGDFTRISGSKSRNASVGSHTIVQNNDVLLSLKGFGSDGTNFEEAAQIEMQVDGSPGNDDMPGRIVFKTTADGASTPTERLRIGSAGQIGIAGANYGTAGQFLQSQGSGSPVQWASVSSDTQFAQWRVTSNWSGNTDPIQNFSEKEHNVDMGYSSGIFSFPTTGFWEIMFQAYCYHNSDQDNIELHIVTTTNNSSYTTRMRSYAHMNNDDGGNLYATVQGTYIFDVTDTSNCKVRFKTAGTSATFQTSSSSNESYAIFKRLAAT